MEFQIEGIRVTSSTNPAKMYIIPQILMASEMPESLHVKTKNLFDLGNRENFISKFSVAYISS